MSKIISAIAVLIMAIIVTIYVVQSKSELDSKTKKQGSTTVSQETKRAKASTKVETLKVATIATQWKWKDTDQLSNEAQKTDQSEALPFTPQSVYDALQAVKLDDNGDLVLDHDALISLDEALERIHKRLDNDTLLKLQDLIKDALPGKVGEQTAQIVGDYQRFLQAKHEFSQIHENSADSYSEQTVQSVENDEALYAELQALREVHLGDDVAKSLFHFSDANAQFMFDSMKLGFDKGLTPEQRATRRQEIEVRLKEQTQAN